MKKRYVFLRMATLVASLILFGSMPSYGEEVRGITDDTIKVGVILDQTGPAASVAQPPTKAIRTLFRFINEQGGIHGRKLKALVEDDHYSMPTVVSSFKKLLYKDGVVFLIGPTPTGGAVALLRSIEKEKIPTIPASSAEVMVKPFKQYIFTTQDIYPGQMKVIVDYIMKDLKANNPRIALVYGDNETGKSDLGPALERLKSYNLEPVAKEVLNPGSIEATSQVINLKKAKPDYVIFCGAISQPVVVLLREMRKFDLKVPLFGSWAACNESIISLAGDAAASMYYSVNAMASWYDKEPGVAKMREVTLKYEPGTDKPYREKVYTLGWVWATVTIEGMRRAGRNLDGEALVNSLERMKNFDTGGLTGSISYSPTNHKGGSTWKVFKADPSTGKFIPMTEWRSPE